MRLTLSFDKVPCWLDARPSLLADRERQAVEKAKEDDREAEESDDRRPACLGLRVWFLG